MPHIRNKSPTGGDLFHGVGPGEAASTHIFVVPKMWSGPRLVKLSAESFILRRSIPRQKPSSWLLRGVANTRHPTKHSRWRSLFLWTHETIAHNSRLVATRLGRGPPLAIPATAGISLRSPIPRRNGAQAPFLGSTNKKRLILFVDPRGIGPRPRPCHGRVIPFYYRPKF
jgi:hypothetical protein